VTLRPSVTPRLPPAGRPPRGPHGEGEAPAEADGRAELAARVRAAGLRPQVDYTTGEAARILGTSRETVRQMIIRWEPPGVPGRHPAGLFARRLRTHRRIPHEALADWLTRNTAYLRDLG
jgi:Helix-turn-helix domain